MKGNVCIELHNHKTGLRDRIEGHNDVTDGLQNMINFMVRGGQSSVYWSPIVNHVLGGLLLLDTQLSGGDVLVPGDSNIIGSGYQGSNTSSAIIGTYNSVESGIDTAGKIFTHVWDFATSQANGTIRSLGLTHNFGGQFPNTLGRPDYSSVINTPYKVIYYDDTHNDIYMVDTSNQDTNCKIYKTHANPYDLMLNFNAEYLTGTVSMVDTTKTINFHGEWNSEWVDGHDGYIYHPIVSRTNVTIYKVKAEDYSFTEANSPILITFPSDIGVYSKIAINFGAGYVYAVDNTNAHLYRYNVSEQTITDINISSFNLDDCTLLTAPDGDVYIRGYDGVSFRVNTAGDVSSAVTTSYNVTGDVTVTDSGLLIWGDRIVQSASTLMTNYNLQTPITKTNLLSMKVIYTLTQG